MSFDDLIKQVRVEVNLSSWPYGARKVDGFPYELPLVVRSDGTIPALNSESRGVLIDYEGKTYKLKGVDPHGNIPKAIRNEKRRNPKSLTETNPLHDLGYEGSLEQLGLKYNPLQEGIDYSSNIECGEYYLHEPFGVLRQTEAINELLVCEKISEYLKDFGFKSPYLPVQYREFKNLFFGKKEVAHIVLEIPSIGSDLRLNEFQRIVRKNKPDLEKSFQISKKIAQWNGFSAKIHEDLKISPIDRSLGWDNYILARVSSDGIGLIKNDHGSTKINSPPSESKLRKIKIDGGSLIRGQKKKKQIQELEERFEKGLNEVPEPIPEDEIMALFEGAYQ